jgi:hypothetical protein
MLAKLTTLHITIIGVVMTLIMSLLLFFLLIKPKKEDIEASHSATDAAQTAGGTPEKVAGHKKDLAKAKQETKVITAAWDINERRYMPKIEFSQRQKSTNLINMYAFNGLYSDGKLYGIRDVPTVWGTKVKTWYDAHEREGIRRAPGQDFPIDSFSTDPNDISKLTSITFPQSKPWHVSVVAKTFDAAMLHMRRFNTMRGFGMPVVDGVALSGQSPNLAMVYDMALYVIPPAAPPAPDPVIGGGGGGAPAAGGGFGGGGFNSGGGGGGGAGPMSRPPGG